MTRQIEISLKPIESTTLEPHQILWVASCAIVGAETYVTKATTVEGALALLAQELATALVETEDRLIPGHEDNAAEVDRFGDIGEHLTTDSTEQAPPVIDPFGDDDDHLPFTSPTTTDTAPAGYDPRPLADQPPFPAHHKTCAKWSRGPTAECSCPEGWGRREHSGPS